MRIAIDGRKIELPLTGMGRYTKNLLTHIARIDKDNEYIVLRTKDFQQKITQAENFRTVVVDYPAFSLQSLFFLHRILYREKVDLFHSPFISAPLFAKCKIILTVYDLIPLKFAKGFGKEKHLSSVLKKIIFRSILLTGVRKAQRIITVSQFSQKELERLDGSLSKKIKVVYPAAEEVFKKSLKREEIEKTKAKFCTEGELILYLGAIRPHKNLVKLLEAVSLLIRKGNLHCHLVIGGGKETELFFLKEMAEKLGISKYVFFTGSLTDSEMVGLLNAADVFIFPSLEEGFGLPPLEAMACGTPVITSDSSSLPEVVGDAALLVDPYNVRALAHAILHLLRDEELRNKLIEKGYERVKLFSWEKTARETLEVYKAVMKEK